MAQCSHVQSYLGLLLKLHGEVIASNSELTHLLAEIKKKEEHEWKRLEGLFHNTLCLLDFFAGRT